jgi:excisionase family DNA binding protein
MSHRHRFSPIAVRFGSFGPQDVHYHPCIETDDCDRVLIAKGSGCARPHAQHVEITLSESSPEMPPDLINVRTAARILGVHENTVRNMADDGRLPHARLVKSGYRRFDRAAVEELAREMRRPSHILPLTAREASILNALVTFAAEQIPGGLSETERSVARKVGRCALGV